MFNLKSDDLWQKLVEDKNRLSQTNIANLFNENPDRFDQFNLNVGDFMIDYSKNLLDQSALNNLISLAAKCELKESIQSMFRGEKINTTENRSVLHVALRNRSSTPLMVDGIDIKQNISLVLKRMADFSNSINNSTLLGYSGKSITNIINIGIGGSDLGPMMAVEALHNFTNPNLNIRFVSNIDFNAFSRSVEGLNPEETLFIISSKTFTTDETMTNAHSARQWIVDALGEESVDRHFVAVSTNVQEVLKFGIDQQNIFEFWDFVGGRYSLCSAIGLSLMIAIGVDNFNDMLDGFNLIDHHFREAPLEANVPVILALISIWYIDFWSASNEAVIPYSENLKFLPAYLQQLVMESNGKSINKLGQRVDYSTSSVIWGGQGTNAQHAFFQLFHQGTQFIPIDLIGFTQSDFGDKSNHQVKLMANLIAQSKALAFGRTNGQSEDVFRLIIGNNPNNVMVAEKLTPSVLGQLLAIYEHKVFVEGVIWQINSFDQFGVELGKEIAKDIGTKLTNGDLNTEYDSSTNNLIKFAVDHKQS